MRQKKCNFIFIIFLLLLFTNCDEPINELHVEKFSTIMDKYNSEELEFIFSDLGLEDLEFDISDRPKVITKFFNENSTIVQLRINEIENKREKAKKLKETLEQYQKAADRAEKLIKELISKYAKYNVRFTEFEDFDGYYYFAAYGRTTDYIDIDYYGEIQISEILKTSMKEAPPELNDIFKLRDKFKSSFLLDRRYKTSTFVVKGTYADVSLFLEQLKLSKYL